MWAHARGTTVIDDLTDWVTDTIEVLGYLGVALLVALESVFPPIPSEVVLPMAGFVAGRGDASVLGMVAASTIGSVIGSWVLYGISSAIGEDRLHQFVERYGRWLGVKVADLQRAEDWFDRRSDMAVFFGRCVPLVRSLVSVPAGFRRMPLLRFTLLSAAGSAMWNLALIGAGALLGEQWHVVGEYVGILQTVVIAAVVAGLAWWVWRRFIAVRFGRSDDAASRNDRSETSNEDERARGQ